MTDKSEKLPVWLGAGYGVGMVGAQIFRDAPALLLLFFMTNTLNVPAVMAGLAITLPKIWVIFADPAAGALSDRTTSPMGRRRPFILAGSVLCGLTFVLIFNVPNMESAAARAAWVGVMYTAALTALSVYSIPYFSVAAEISDSPAVRTKIVAYRIAFMATGLIISGLAPVLTAHGGDGRSGYAFMSYVFAAVCVITMLVPFFVLARVPLKGGGGDAPGFLTQVKLAAQNKPFVWLVSANFVQRVAEGCGYAALAYFVVYRLELDLGALTGLVVAVSASGIVAQPLWVRIAARIGKVRAYWLALPLYCVSFLMWYFAPPQNMLWVYVIAGLNGLLNSGFLLMAQSMLTDTIALDARRTGLDRAGAFSGIWLANEKVAFTFGAMITAAILGASGFVSGDAGGAVRQTDSAVQGIVIAFVFTPIVFHLSSLLLLRHYKLDERAIAETPGRAGSAVNPAE